MATIGNEPNGLKRILFVGLDGKRRTIRPGRVPMAKVENFRDKISLLETYAKTHRPPDRETAAWAGRVGDAIYDKLADGGLVEPRPSTTSARTKRAKLGTFLDDYIAKQNDKKRSTIVCLKQCRNDLVEFFGFDKLLSQITEGDAEEWRQWLRSRNARPGRQKSPTARLSKASYRDRDKPKLPPKRLQENTIRRRCGRARQLLQAAVRYRLISRNPFAELKGVSVLANKSRDFFVTRETAELVVAACPDNQWKLLFMLSRYAGLRCPSEHLSLRWSDIDWVLGRMVIRSPKTEHHEGKEHRVIPLFPELRPYLEAVRDEVNLGVDVPLSDPVITRYRDVNANLRTQFLRILANAGIQPWPKLFQNLRASRATELAQEYPGHVAAAWLGHTTAVAQKHYWQVTDADFDRATCSPSAQPASNPHPAQQPAQSVAHQRRQTVPAIAPKSKSNAKIKGEHSWSNTEQKISGRGGSRTRTGVAPQRILSP
jgi:integrase